jgi:hypothetical protein
MVIDMPDTADFVGNSTQTLTTGVGSMPGKSPNEAMSVIAGEVPGLPFLPELPARGPGADMIGRTGAMLAGISGDLNLEPVPTGWRLASAPTQSMRMAKSWLGEDQDYAEERFGNSEGLFKLQLAGPWTFAASVETAKGALALGDAGLVREIGEATVLAMREFATRVSARLPNRRIVVQVDEPALPGVLRGSIPTASKYSSYAAIPEADAAAILTAVAALGRDPADRTLTGVVLHCCEDFPFQVAQTAGFAGISLDLTRPVAAWRDEGVAAAVEAGRSVHAGVLPALPDLTQTGPEPVLNRLTSQGWGRLESLWSRTGLSAERLGDVTVTESCGFAGATWPHVRAALAAANQIAQRCHTR